MDLNYFNSQNRIKEQTKDRFDSLLKHALNSKREKDAQNRAVHKVESVNDSSSENELEPSNNANPNETKLENVEIVEVDVHNAGHNKNFILNKFLNDSTNMTDASSTQETFIKPPVPRPRTRLKSSKASSSRSSSRSSAGTYNITSPTVIHNVDAANGSNESVTIKETDTKERNKDNSEAIEIDTVESSSTESPKTVRKFSNNLPKDETKHAGHGDDDSVHSTPVSVKDELRYENELKAKRKSYKKRLTRISVHKADYLKLSSLAIHPVVKIHVVNSETGEYIRKSDQNRPVVFFYENKDIPYITPVISEAYNLYEKRTLYPAWEKTLIINEDAGYLLNQDNSPMVFFEVMDFVSFSTANSQFYQKDTATGWNKIAWAFLKLIGKNNCLNTEKRSRLQLYYPGKCKKVTSGTCDIFHWWASKKFKKYPSSLYVTVKSITPPDKVIETLRSKTPMSGDRASRIDFKLEPHVNHDFHTNQINNENTTGQETENKAAGMKLNRNICEIPNRLVAEFSSYDEGCLVMQFSRNGFYLACAVVINDIYSVVIYSVETFEEIWNYAAHQGLIYSITWSCNDEYILTASADCTVCICDFRKRIFSQILPHPSYVYACVINSNNVIATGCYDQTVRIWSRDSYNKTSYNLTQELDGHNGYITSLCFNNKSTLLYSSDSLGVIIEWKINDCGDGLNLKREVKLIDLRDTIINQIMLHPKERRLLIHARDGTLRIIDLKTVCVLHWLQGGLNTRFQTLCSYSLCGTYIYAGSETGAIKVWNSDSGRMVEHYSPYDALSYKNVPVHCVQFHTRDNILVASHYGHSVPILMIKFEEGVDEKNDIGLRYLKNEDGASKNESKKVGEAAEKVVNKSSSSDSNRKRNKLKLRDVIEKIDQIIISKPVASDLSCKDSVND